MKIETQPRDDHQVSMVVEIDSDTFESHKRKAARKISKETRIAGFRPGKAPYDVVRRHYGDEAIINQAMEDMVNDIYPKALTEAEIEPSGPGQLEETLSVDPPKFSFTVPLPPEIELCDYHSIKKEYVVEPVTEKHINNVLRRLQVNNAIAEPVEDRAAKIGDLVALELDGQLTQTEDEKSGEIVTKQPLQVIIEEENTLEENPWPYAEFSKELIGLNQEEEKSFVYTYPEDSEYDDLQGKEVNFTIRVKSIKSLVLPELDDEFASTLGDFDSIDKLKENIQESLEANSKQEYEQKYLDELVSTIVEQSSVKYPPHYLEEEIKTVIQNFEQNLARQRMDIQTYLKAIQSDMDTIVENQFKPMAIKQLERALVLQEIIKQENIKLEQNELQSAVAQTLYGMSNDQSRNLPRGVTRGDMVNAATYEMANRLLSRNLMRRLKSIASGEPEEPVVEAEDVASTEDNLQENAVEEDAVLAEENIESNDTEESGEAAAQEENQESQEEEKDTE